VRLIGSPGQRNDIAFAHELIEASPLTSQSPTRATTPIICAPRLLKAAAILSFRPSGTARSSVPMTPSSTRSATSLSASSNKLKQFRRLATRYDKLLANFMGFVKLAAIAIWLKELNRHYGLVVRSKA
jgi:putative transposase